MLYLRTYLCICMLGCLSQTALGQNISASAQQVAKADPAERKKLERRLEDAVARRIRETLGQKVDDFLSRRIERTGYTISIEPSLDKKKLSRLIGGIDSEEVSSLILAVSRRDYDSLRSYLKNAVIGVGIADYLSETEWSPVVNALQSQFEGGGERVESVEVNLVSLPLPLQERAIKTRGKEELKNIEREYQLRQQAIELDR